MDASKRAPVVVILMVVVCVRWLGLAQCGGNDERTCPAPTVRCGEGGNFREGCEITNFRGRWEDKKDCKASMVVYPRNQEELVGAVADAVRDGAKIKVMSGGAHTFTRFPCPGGSHGVVINTRDFASLIRVDEHRMTVTVDSGVLFSVLIERLARHGLAIPQSTYWDSLSVAGVLCTAAHGSGVGGPLGGAVFEQVEALSLVIPAPPHLGFAKVVWLSRDRHADDFQAAVASLGVLGAISRVTFGVEKMFKRKVVLREKTDTGFEEGVVEFLRKHEFADLTWLPSLGRVVYREDDRVPVATAGDGQNQQILFQPRTVQAVQQSRQLEEKIQKTKDSRRMCKIAASQYLQTINSGFGFLNNEENFTGFPVIGYNHKMQSSSQCQTTSPSSPSSESSCMFSMTLSSQDKICGWDSRINGTFFFHTSIAIPLRNLVQAITDIKRLRDINSQAFCALDLYGGLLMRTVKKSQAYLGFKEDTVDIEFFYYRSRHPNVPRWNEDVMEEVEQILLYKYEGRPHWAKNRIFTFEGAAEKAVSIDKFREAKRRLDPFGFFSSEWSDAVLGEDLGYGNRRRRVERLKDRCAHDGLCVCRADHHCSPHLGFFCRPGKVWKSANVCREEPPS